MAIETPDLVHASGSVALVTGPNVRFIRQWGFQSISRLGVGVYSLLLDQALPDTQASCSIVGRDGYGVIATLIHLTDTVKVVYLFANDGNARDASFDITIYALPLGSDAVAGNPLIPPSAGTIVPPFANVQNNYAATRDPLSSDDDTEGYSVGSAWINIYTYGLFRMMSSETGDAEWIQIGWMSDMITGNVDLYVDNINGNDNNTGLDPLEPLLSIDAVLARLAPVTLQSTFVHLVSTGTPYALPDINSRLYQESVYIIGEDPTLVATGTADSGSGTEVVVDTGLVADAWRGFTIVMTSGAASGARRTIRNNTTTQIIPAIAFPAAVAAGDTYEIYRPSVELDTATVSGDRFITGSPIMPPVASGTRGSPVATLQFVYVRFIRSTGSAFLFFDGLVGFWGCESTTTVFNNGQLQAGIDSFNPSAIAQGALPFRDGLAPSILAWGGFGMAVTAAGGIACGGSFMGFIVATLFQGQDPNCNANILGGNLYGNANAVSPVQCLNGASIILGQSITAAVAVLVTAPIAATSAACLSQGIGARLTLKQATLTGNATGTASLLSQNGAQAVSESNTLVTSSGAPYGGLARRGGRIYVTGSGSGLAGSTAALAVGNTPDTAASLAATGSALLPTTAPVDGSVIQRL